MKFLLTILLLTLTSFAQTVVVPLSPEDAARVKSVKEQVDAVNKLWEKLQADIGKKYLVVEKDSPDASDHSWDPPDNSHTWGYSCSDQVLNLSAPCPTEEARKKYDADLAKCHEAQKHDREVQEQRSKRIRRGFDSERDFIFSNDWRYLLPKPQQPSYNGNQIMIDPMPWGYRQDQGIVINPK